MTTPTAQTMLELANELYNRIAPQRFAGENLVSRDLCERILACFRAATRASQPAAQAPEPDSYRTVIDEALVVRHLGVAKGNPREELNQILSWEVAVALDPRVSEAAQALIDQGQAPAGTGGDASLRLLVDIVWNEATESTAVPATEWADRLIAKYRLCYPFAPPQAPDAVREKAQDLIDIFAWEPSEESGEVEPHLNLSFPDFNERLTALRAAVAPPDAGSRG